MAQSPARCIYWIGPQASAQFAQALAEWRSAAPPLGLLHGVCITPTAPTESATPPEHRRVAFEHGRVLLTQSSGVLSAVLAQIGGLADEIVLDARTALPTWDVYLCKALARRCRVGAWLRIVHWPGTLPTQQALLLQCGFAAQPAPANTWLGQYLPHWQTSPSGRHPADTAPGHCIVLGAGLAGAAAASSLARRGWQVAVLDPGASAHGASGVPAGLLAPHVSKDDSVQSRVSRAGLQATWAQARELLTPGADWAQTGVYQRAAQASEPPTFWHESGGWIKPARLVHAWLSQKGITVHEHAAVGQVMAPDQTQPLWRVLDTEGRSLAQAQLLVIAAGTGTAAWLNALHAPLAEPSQRVSAFLQTIRGQVTCAHYAPGDGMDALLPTTPVNGDGSLIPHIPMNGRLMWLCGASYQRGDSDLQQRESDQQSNLARLRCLLPGNGTALAQLAQTQAAQGLLQAWVGLRCATTDRLPVVGPLCKEVEATGLWLCTGLGSRGLTYAALCGELLAARLHQEPLPLPFSLARCMDSARI
ncbi:MAG: FAD-dependent oxidoreductase [Burkholderiaceae bacterium]